MADAGGQSPEPGFGDVPGADALPDMSDTLPSFEDSVAADSTGSGTSGMGESTAAEANGVTHGNGDSTGTTANDGSAPAPATGGPGTRAEGGLESMNGTDAVLTTAEQVAILDRQLEQSTSDFDAMILEEQERQRAVDRARSERTARETPEPAGPGTRGPNPYRDDVAEGGASGGGGGIGGASEPSTAASNPAVHKAPKDIPDGNDDDVVARQLREAAMREPDPEVRERLWNEYRKYKGLDIPE